MEYEQPRCGECGAFLSPDESIVHTKYGDVPMIFYICHNPRCSTNKQRERTQ